jgi:hypothetical protein
MSFRITNITNGSRRAGDIEIAAGETLILPALPANMDELVRSRSVEIIDLSNTTRSYDWANSQKVVVGASDADSAAINAFEIMLISTTACFVTVGANPTAGDTAGSTYLPAGERLHMQITPSFKVSVVQVSAGGSLFITPVLPLL